MQQAVGGIIQAVYPFEDTVTLICNDEGKPLGLPFNRGLKTADGKLYDVICGTFFLCAAPADSDHLESLLEEQLLHYEELFRYPEMLAKVNGELICIPTYE